MKPDRDCKKPKSRDQGCGNVPCLPSLHQAPGVFSWHWRKRKEGRKESGKRREKRKGERKRTKQAQQVSTAGIAN